MLPLPIQCWYELYSPSSYVELTSIIIIITDLTNYVNLIVGSWRVLVRVGGRYAMRTMGKISPMLLCSTISSSEDRTIASCSWMASARTVGVAYHLHLGITNICSTSFAVCQKTDTTPMSGQKTTGGRVPYFVVLMFYLLGSWEFSFWQIGLTFFY